MPFGRFLSVQARIGLVAALLGLGCSAPPPAHVLERANVPSDRTLRVVAESADAITLTSAGSRTIVGSGVMLYEGSSDGRLEAVAPDASYGAFVPDVDAAVGFATWSQAPSIIVPTTDSVVLGAFDGTMPAMFRIGGSKAERLAVGSMSTAVAWRGAIVGAATYGYGGELVTTGGATPKVPSNFRVEALAVGHADSLVALARSAGGAGRLLVWSSPEAEPISIELPPHRWIGECSMPPAFDGETYVVCRPNGDTATTLYQVDGTSLRARTAPEFGRALSIGADGTLFYSPPGELTVKHCARDGGPCKELPMEKNASIDTLASWQQGYTDVVERGGSRSWVGIRAAVTEGGALGWVEAIHARSESDVWVVARRDRARAVLHTGLPRPRMRLAAVEETHFVARNASAPSSWAAHCDQVFVVLAEAAGDKALDVERVAREKEKVGAVLDGQGLSWTLVAGRLHDARVAGVLVSRASADTKVATLEARTRGLVDAYTPNPLSRPRTTCTVPVLERVLE